MERCLGLSPTARRNGLDALLSVRMSYRPVLPHPSRANCLFCPEEQDTLLMLIAQGNRVNFRPFLLEIFES